MAQLKIAFFSHCSAYNHSNIGGLESYIRRMAAEFITQGNTVFYVSYGNKGDSDYHAWGIAHFARRDINSALKVLESGCHHVVEIYVLPEHRLKFARFRCFKGDKIKFHFIMFNWADSYLRRFLYFAEPRYFPYNGKLICISKRQYEFTCRWAKNASFLLPPVPDDYFIEEKLTQDSKIRLTFLGRIDPGKGINEVISIFEHLQDDKKFELAIYGMHIANHTPSERIHKQLSKQSSIKYVHIERCQYSPKVDELVRNVLRESDIFIQPYQRLSSTIDTPLLLLEAMAALCAVITKPFGNIPDIYGDSPFLIREKDFVLNVLRLLAGLDTATIIEERERLLKLTNTLQFKAGTVSQKFLDAINA
jgi:glycosyltransferase involved in cell wall biosynthesis